MVGSTNLFLVFKIIFDWFVCCHNVPVEAIFFLYYFSVFCMCSHADALSYQIFRYYFGHEFLVDVVNKICNNVRGINRVCYDITSKPPATVEWE